VEKSESGVGERERKKREERQKHPKIRILSNPPPLAFWQTKEA